MTRQNIGNSAKPAPVHKPSAPLKPPAKAPAPHGHAPTTAKLPNHHLPAEGPAPSAELEKHTGKLGANPLPPPPQPEEHHEEHHGLLGGLFHKAEDAASSVVNHVEDTATSVVHGAGNLVNDALKGTENLANEALKGVENLGSDVVHGIEHLGSDVGHLGEGFLHAGEHAAAFLARHIGRSHLDSHAAHTKTYGTEAEAKAAYQAGSKALLDVNNWKQKLAPGIEGAKFGLYDAHGNTANRSAKVGDFVRINLPGDKLDTDWVRIEKAEVGPDKTQIVVRPSYDPTRRPLRKDITAHFFTSEATNTFTVERFGKRVEGHVDGHDESANVGKESGGDLQAVRNRLAVENAWGLQVKVPLIGEHVNGIQQLQWNDFTGGLVQADA